MRRIDRVLQAWRGAKARPWVPKGARVLDIGCHQGEFLRSLGDRLGPTPSVGYDPLATSVETPRYRLIAEAFPIDAKSPFDDESFDAVVMLATLEHVREKGALAVEIARLLRPDGRLIVTVPAPAVDAIVEGLRRLGLADGMSLEEHHGFDPRETPAIFGARGLATEHARRFQLGMNHLYVLTKSSAAAGANPSPSARPSQGQRIRAGA